MLIYIDLEGRDIDKILNKLTKNRYG